jgi:anti-sigma factor RsiW
MNCEQARELITALVDNEVSELERSLVEGHLEGCSRCRSAHERERAVKSEIQNVAVRMTAPLHLKNKILADHRIAPKEAEFVTQWKNVLFFRPSGRPAFAVALLLVGLLPIIYFLAQPRSQPIAVAALRIQARIIGGELPLHKARDQKELRNWQMRAVNGKIAPMEYDLSGMLLQPIGGLVQDVDGRPMLVTVYSGNGPSITCFTFLGTERDAPEDATVFLDQHRNMKFYTFSKNGYNAVLHREGNVICLLVSNMPAEKLFALAMGKADRA